MKKILKEFNDKTLFETQNDFDFFHRVFNDGDLSKYQNRLKAIGAYDLENVLDSGCGFGQWSFALSSMNKKITSYDVAEDRIKIANDIKYKLKNNNINFINTKNPNSIFKDNQFDFIFSYGVVQCTPYKEKLSQYYRMLKPGGKLYFSAADIGWFIYYAIDGHNDTEGYSTREWGIDTLVNSLNYHESGEFKEGSNTIIPYKSITTVLEKIGFNSIKLGEDGSINLDNSVTTERFFPFKKYNEIAIYEVLCSKPAI